MVKIKGLMGQRFGRLVVKNLAYTKGASYWNCICDCEKETIARGTHLTYGNIKSCGCFSRDKAKERKGKNHSMFKNLVDEKFGLLTVIKRVDGKDNKRVYWLCNCDCGGIAKVEASHLKSGHTKSCGCEQIKKGKKHYAWKGGRIKNKDGYIDILIEKDNPYYCMANGKGYVLEHRLILAKKLGRPLRNYEMVHHLNGIKDDNRPENLELVNNTNHALITKMEKIIRELEKENKKLKSLCKHVVKMEGQNDKKL